MKALINKKVWELPAGEIIARREPVEFECLSSHDSVSAAGNAFAKREYNVDLVVPISCCTKKLNKFLNKKRMKNKSIPIVFLNDNREILVRGLFEGLPAIYGNEITYKLSCDEQPMIRELINWDEVENEI